MPLVTRYYIYISDTKIEMLLPQVEEVFKQKVAAEIGFDIHLLSGKIATERTTLDSRVAQLKVVERHLLFRGMVGSTEQPVSWIQGEVVARTVSIGDGGVLFVSSTPKMLLGLAGSAQHILGGTKPKDAALPFSFLPRILNQLTHWFKVEFEKFPSVITKDLPEERARAQFAPSGVSQGFDAWNDILLAAWGQAEGTEQKIQFLARRLASKVEYENTANENVVTLATPLFVALSE